MIRLYRVLALLLLFFAVFIKTSNGRAEDSSDMIPLQFQADKNNVQILPQRFEYNLEDEDNIKIGDIVIDPTTFGFQVAPAPNQPGKYRVRFVWPSALLREGVISIKDNTGKAIWSTAVSKRNTRLISSGKPKSANSMARTQLVEYYTDQLQESLIEDMKYFPFMNFCINKATQDTSIYLCSKEVFLSLQDGKLGVRSRSQTKRASFAEINGKSVGNQGIIFLNDEQENIGFRALTQSGAILEIETRMKPVDFKDVVLSEDGKSLILTASGAEPVAEEKVKRIANDSWQIQVNAERPILYLKGAGNIPMRQEFHIKGAVPAENIRPYLSKDSVGRAYKSEIQLSGRAAKKTNISAENNGQKVEMLDGNKFSWTLEQIPAGKISRHYLRINDDKNSFIAAYDIYRDYAYEAGALGALAISSTQLYGNLFVNWWIENFAGNDQGWARLHWGLRLEQTLVFNKKDDQVNLNTSRLELLWRSTPGFHFLDPTWGIILPYELIQATGLSVASPGLGIFYNNSPATNFKKWMSWYDAKFIYLLGGEGDVKLNNALLVQGLAYIKVTDQLSWNYGLGLNRYSFDSGNSPTQIQILGGATYLF